VYRRDLIEIRAAISKVSKGTYGYCEACGKEIPTSRLVTRPWAKYCYPCQVRFEEPYDSSSQYRNSVSRRNSRPDVIYL
jgi:RNA polymerase-binding transcription factor DksA